MLYRSGEGICGVLPLLPCASHFPGLEKNTDPPDSTSSGNPGFPFAGQLYASFLASPNQFHHL